MLALRSSQLWLASHSIVQQRAGCRQLSELHRTTPRSKNILACLPASPSNGVATTWSSKSSTKLRNFVNAQLSTPPLGAWFSGNPWQRALHRRRGQWARKDACFITWLSLVRGTCFCISAGIALRRKLEWRSIRTVPMTTILGFQGVGTALLRRNAESCSQPGRYFSAF